MDLIDWGVHMTARILDGKALAETIRRISRIEYPHSPSVASFRVSEPFS